MAIALAIKLPVDEPRMSKAATAVVSGALGRHGHVRGLPAISSAERSAAELDRFGTRVLCRKGQTLVQEGDCAEYVFKVTSGALRAVRLLPDGRRYIANFLMPGDFFGLADVEIYAHSVEAIADAGLVRYARSSVEALLDREPGAGRRFFGVMCKELSAVQDRLLLLGRKTAAERLASFLLTMAARRAEDDRAEDCEIELPMNRSDMADYLGLRIETICRLLTDLKGRRIIELPSIHSVVILRREALEALSEGSA